MTTKLKGYIFYAWTVTLMSSVALAENANENKTFATEYDETNSFLYDEASSFDGEEFFEHLCGSESGCDVVPEDSGSGSGDLIGDTSHPGDMRCGDGNVIGKDKICDRIIDCFDCSDEQDCNYAENHIFMCYEEDEALSITFSSENKKCIELDRYCDGIEDCKNGADERKYGFGFRCNIVGRYRQCILPQRYICDYKLHCEDHSDMCPDEWSGRDPLNINSIDKTLSQPRYTEAYKGLFGCLEDGLLISQRQVCDGTFDCMDLSDECLCEEYRSDSVKDICGGLCALPLWKNQPKNPNCIKCEQGQIYRESPLYHIGKKGNGNSLNRYCFSPQEIAQDFLSLIDGDDENENEMIIECFGHNDKTIRARKCDGRPECRFGRDECGFECQNSAKMIGNGEEKEQWSGDDHSANDPEFCRLFSSGSIGAVCLSEISTNGTTNREDQSTSGMRLIRMCDGINDCRDGSDEILCPKRYPCSNDSAGATFQSYDEAQRCDGFNHCSNGKDEKNCTYQTHLSLPCDDIINMDKDVATFQRKYILDGVEQCETGDDECPPFFSRILQIKTAIYDNELKSKQISISSHDRAIDSMALQIFVIAVSFIGVSALSVSFVLGIYNITITWVEFCKDNTKDRKTWISGCFIYAREVVVHIGITVAKALICGFFVYIRFTRTEETNYSKLDLNWRSSPSCVKAGSIALIGCQIPIVSLAVFTLAVLAFDRISRAKDCKRNIVRSENDRLEGLGRKRKRSNRPLVYNAILAIACLGLLIVIWMPISAVAILLQTNSTLHYQTQTYGWVKSEGASALFKANLLTQSNAQRFLNNLMALTNHSSKNITIEGSNVFSFYDFSVFANNISPELRLITLGSFGYFSQSGTCLPAFMVHADGGDAPYDIAVSNTSTAALSILIISTNFALIFITAVLITRYGAGICKVCALKPLCEEKEKLHTLNRTFSRLVLIETLTWVLIPLAFLLKYVLPDIATDRAYATFTIVVLGLNCGIATPFVLLMRKFRVGKPIKNNNNWSQKDPISTRIIEERSTSHSEEVRPLNTVDKSPKDTDELSERHSLLESERAASVKDIDEK